MTGEFLEEYESAREAARLRGPEGVSR